MKSAGTSEECLRCQPLTPGLRAWRVKDELCLRRPLHWQCRQRAATGGWPVEDQGKLTLAKGAAACCFSYVNCQGLETSHPAQGVCIQPSAPSLAMQTAHNTQAGQHNIGIRVSPLHMQIYSRHALSLENSVQCNLFSMLQNHTEKTHIPSRVINTLLSACHFHS